MKVDIPPDMLLNYMEAAFRQGYRDGVRDAGQIKFENPPDDSPAESLSWEISRIRTDYVNRLWKKGAQP